MRTLLALLRREYIEHRGAFFYAPAILLGIFTLGIAFAILGNRFKVLAEVGAPDSLKFYQIGFLGMSQLWWLFLLATLFFYFADAFSADRRNNAMFFWKSMPVSDFCMLGSKMLAGMVLFPAIAFGFVLLIGIILYLLTLLGIVLLPNLIVPGVPAAALSFASISLFALCHFVLGLLWYAPFFAWVGGLSTVFRRWSIPLAFLIPGVLSLLENAAFFGNVPPGGYIYGFLSHRLQFGLDRETWAMATFIGTSVDVPRLIAQLLAGIDWLSLCGGLVVAAILVYAASRYRRRSVVA